MLVNIQTFADVVLAKDAGATELRSSTLSLTALFTCRIQSSSQRVWLFQRQLESGGTFALTALTREEIRAIQLALFSSHKVDLVVIVWVAHPRPPAHGGDLHNRVQPNAKPSDFLPSPGVSQSSSPWGCSNSCVPIYRPAPLPCQCWASYCRRSTFCLSGELGEELKTGGTENTPGPATDL